jgi:hypothetical protein
MGIIFVSLFPSLFQQRSFDWRISSYTPSRILQEIDIDIACTFQYFSLFLRLSKRKTKAYKSKNKPVKTAISADSRKEMDEKLATLDLARLRASD